MNISSINPLDNWKEYLKYKNSPSLLDFDLGLANQNIGPRKHWSKITWTGFKPSAQQIEKGLTDPVDEVRQNWAYRQDYTPTPEQIERAMLDDDSEVAYKMASRQDVILSDVQLERIFKKDAARILNGWLKNKNAKITDLHIDRIFELNIPITLAALANREDIVLSEERIKTVSELPKAAWVWVKVVEGTSREDVIRRLIARATAAQHLHKSEIPSHLVRRM